MCRVLKNNGRKKNPKADLDDFDDYLDSIGFDADKDEHLQKSLKIRGDSEVLRKGNTKINAILASAISSVYLAPVAGLATRAITKSGKAAVGVALGTIAGTTMLNAIAARREQINIYNKYSKLYNNQ